VESLDEGLGDVSNECEHQANDHLGDQNDNNNNNSDEFETEYIHQKVLNPPSARENHCKF
jgi:hypothetical protein